jgi:hypothetical protein
VAGGWRETHENNNFIHSARPQAPDPRRIGIAKTMVQFAATHLTGRIANRGLFCQAKRLPKPITCVSEPMLRQRSAGAAKTPPVWQPGQCAKFERKSF